jgi:hypothetical protein
MVDDLRYSRLSPSLATREYRRLHRPRAERAAAALYFGGLVSDGGGGVVVEFGSAGEVVDGEL